MSLFDQTEGLEEKDIKDIRDELDNLDNKILECFIERMRLSEQVAKYKADNNMPIEDTTREMEILKDISSKSGEFSTYSSSLFRSIMGLSKDYQEFWIRSYNEEKKRQVEEMPGVYGLLGHHLSHSYSEKIHQMLGLAGNVAYDYKLLETEPEGLEGLLTRPDVQGLNVTIPYKTAVLTFCEGISDDVLNCGAANTIVNRDGKLYAYNTDIGGFKYMVYASGINVENKKVLVLGSGGASKAVCAALRDLGAGQIVVISRNGANSYDNLDLHSDTNIIVNTTPVGMYPDNLNKPISLKQFPKLTGVLDVIYNPELTGLLLEAEQLGIPHAGGLHMLVAQAKESYELFFNRKLPNSVIVDVVNKLRSESENVILMGMPGCGKSTIAKALSNATGRDVIDIDREIEKTTGKSPSEIIIKYGEDKFREYEHNEILRCCKESGKIIALGGGAILNKENIPAIRQNGKVFFIRRDIELLPTDGRPLSKSPETLKEMQKIRLPIYQDVADIEIENNGTVEDAVKSILKFI